MNNSEYWLQHAQLASTRACCATSRKVGAVIISQDDRMLSMGYNGVPSKVPHPTVCKRKLLNLKSGEQPHLCGCIHAEANAIINAAREGVSIKGAVLYCTAQPCITCCGMIINAGIKMVIFRDIYEQDQKEFQRMLRCGDVRWNYIGGV